MAPASDGKQGSARECSLVGMELSPTGFFWHLAGDFVAGVAAQDLMLEIRADEDRQTEEAGRGFTQDGLCFLLVVCLPYERISNLFKGRRLYRGTCLIGVLYKVDGSLCLRFTWVGL